MLSVEIRVFVAGMPHSFLVITDKDGVEHGYGFYPASDGSPSNYGIIKDDIHHKWNETTGKIPLTVEEYNKLVGFIKNSIDNPPAYSVYFGSHCSHWAMKGLIEAGLQYLFSPDMEPSGPVRDAIDTLAFNPYTQYMTYSILNLFKSAAAAMFKDPLILDLDNDGVETINVKDGAYFDHDGNGFAEQTGWAGSDDGILTLDRNSDGIINDGKELFGDQTILQNGQRAADGFQALAELDTNSDGVIDINDTQFSQLKVWQDIDGDGYSSSDELFTLQEMGIASINVAHTDTNTVDPNGNTQVQQGSFTKTDNTTGQIGGFNLRRDATYTIATDWLDIPDDIATLPVWARQKSNALFLSEVTGKGRICLAAVPTLNALSGQK